LSWALTVNCKRLTTTVYFNVPTCDSFFIEQINIPKLAYAVLMVEFKDFEYCAKFLRSGRFVVETAKRLYHFEVGFPTPTFKMEFDDYDFFYVLPKGARFVFSREQSLMPGVLMPGSYVLRDVILYEFLYGVFDLFED